MTVPLQNANDYHIVAIEYVGTDLGLPMLGSSGDVEGDLCVVRIYLPFGTAINLNELNTLRKRIEAKHNKGCTFTVRACEDALVLDMTILLSDP